MMNKINNEVILIFNEVILILLHLSFKIMVNLKIIILRLQFKITPFFKKKHGVKIKFENI